MRAVGRWPHEVNASVGNLLTDFTTSGRPELVADFLGAICRALSDLPVDDLALELGVLETEADAVLTDEPGGHLTAHWDDIVGVGVHKEGHLLVQTGDGVSVPLRAQDWRGGSAAIAAIRAHVPERLFFQAAEDDRLFVDHEIPLSAPDPVGERGMPWVARNVALTRDWSDCRNRRHGGD